MTLSIIESISLLLDSKTFIFDVDKEVIKINFELCVRSKKFLVAKVFSREVRVERLSDRISDDKSLHRLRLHAVSIMRENRLLTEQRALSASYR